MISPEGSACTAGLRRCRPCPGRRPRRPTCQSVRRRGAAVAAAKRAFLTDRRPRTHRDLGRERAADYVPTHLPEGMPATVTPLASRTATFCHRRSQPEPRRWRSSALCSSTTVDAVSFHDIPRSSVPRHTALIRTRHGTVMAQWRGSRAPDNGDRDAIRGGPHCTNTRNRRSQIDC